MEQADAARVSLRGAEDVSLLTSILIFCGLGRWPRWCWGCSWAGARAAIRVMQGKPAATEPEFLRIDLSGRSAKIQTGRVGGEPAGIVRMYALGTVQTRAKRLIR